MVLLDRERGHVHGRAPSRLMGSARRVSTRADNGAPGGNSRGGVDNSTNRPGASPEAPRRVVGAVHSWAAARLGSIRQDSATPAGRSPEADGNSTNRPAGGLGAQGRAVAGTRPRPELCAGDPGRLLRGPTPNGRRRRAPARG